jgi:hypothetical protein
MDQWYFHQNGKEFAVPNSKCYYCPVWDRHFRLYIRQCLQVHHRNRLTLFEVNIKLALQVILFPFGCSSKGEPCIIIIQNDRWKFGGYNDAESVSRRKCCAKQPFERPQQFMYFVIKAQVIRQDIALYNFYEQILHFSVKGYDIISICRKDYKISAVTGCAKLFIRPFPYFTKN